MADYDDTFPTDGYVRGCQVFNDPKSGKRGFLNISKSSFYVGIARGIYPPPYKPTERTSLWSAKEIRMAAEGKWSPETNTVA